MSSKNTNFFPQHGVLNRIEKPYISPKINLENYKLSTVYKEFIRDFYTPNVFKDTGPYKGIVLRIENKNKPEDGSWLSNYFKKFFGDNIPTLTRIKVRIPELHSMLPIPKTIGPDSEEHFIIDMYPTFVAQNNSPELSKEPEINSLVWVDFGNKINYTDPIYLGPIDIKIPGYSGNSSGQNSFLSPCMTKLFMDSNNGDENVGNNLSLSHSGLPLLLRKKSEICSEKQKSFKGKEVNSIVYSNWITEIKNNNLECLS